VEGLEHFLAFSDEDTVDIDSILKQLPNYAGSTLEDLKSKGYGRVLDIGSGNGAKAIYLARRLQDLNISIVVDSLEPKAEQRARLAENYQGENKQFLGAVSGKTLGEIQISETYDLALAIHSLYEFPRNNEGDILSLDSLGYIISERGAGIIIIEHPESDFQRMKREIYPSFGKNPPVSQNILVRSLKTALIPYKISDTIESRFCLDRIIDEQDAKIGKIMSFLFSDSLDDQSLTDNGYCTVGRWVKNNARNDKRNHSYLWTPDISVWTYSRQRETGNGPSSF
jgi:SAM-dependent methyltransferase